MESFIQISLAYLGNRKAKTIKTLDWFPVTVVPSSSLRKGSFHTENKSQIGSKICWSSLRIQTWAPQCRARTRSRDINTFCNLIQIHFVIWTNIFCNLDRYVEVGQDWKPGPRTRSSETNTLFNLKQMHFVIWTNIFCNQNLGPALDQVSSQASCSQPIKLTCVPPYHLQSNFKDLL